MRSGDRLRYIGEFLVEASDVNRFSRFEPQDRELLCGPFRMLAPFGGRTSDGGESQICGIKVGFLLWLVQEYSLEFLQKGLGSWVFAPDFFDQYWQLREIEEDTIELTTVVAGASARGLLDKMNENERRFLESLTPRPSSNRGSK